MKNEKMLFRRIVPADKFALLSQASALLLAANLSAHDTGLSLAINFGADEPPGAGSALAPTDKAGAVPQFNWNNANGASGSAVNLTKDFSGAAQASSVSVYWFCPNTWSSTGRGEENNGFPPGGDRIMITGYLDTTDNSTGNAVVTISGLGPEFTLGGYDVLVYCVGSVSGRGGAYTIGSTTKFGRSPATPGAHVEDPGVDLNDTGTYVRFTGLHNASFTLTASADGTVFPGKVNFRAPINGIQIVAAPESDSNDWFALSSGGGHGSGVDFELFSTIGQPLAGGMSGSDYALEGGFWSILPTLVDTLVIQCPTNPILVTLPCNSNCVPVSYPLPTVANGTLASCTPPSGTCLPAGLHTILCRATNESTEAECTFTVRVDPEQVQPPVLRITLAGPNSVLISWPAPSTCWALQQSPTLGPSANWTEVGVPVVVNGADNTVTQTMATGSRFYRLNHP
jgi:hypothetical protein